MDRSPKRVLGQRQAASGPINRSRRIMNPGIGVIPLQSAGNQSLSPTEVRCLITLPCFLEQSWDEIRIALKRSLIEFLRSLRVSPLLQPDAVQIDFLHRRLRRKRESPGGYSCRRNKIGISIDGFGGGPTQQLLSICG